MARSKQESIYQRKDGMWVAVLELPTKNGKRRRRLVYGSTEKAAKQKLKTERRTLEDRGDLPTSSPTLEWWMNYWLKHVAPISTRPNTLVGYEAVVRNHIIPAIGKRKLSKLMPDDIREVHDRILSTPKKKAEPDGPKLSSTYALNAHRILARALKIAEREGKVGRNPCDLMDAPRKTAPQLEALDIPEAKAVLKKAAEALDAPGDYDPMPMLYAFYLLTASRRGEALGLEWSRVSTHLDVNAQLQRIRDISQAPADYATTHLVGNFYLAAVKTNAGNRVLPLVDPLKTMLTLHSQRAGVSPHGLVFCHADGAPIDPDSVTVGWQRWLTRSGITSKHVRLHDLRHTTVDLLYEAHVPEDIIIDIVGHSTRMQSRAYKVRRSDPRLTSAMEALSGLLT
ncbi:integrase-like protein [Leucobacter luti]|uniref:tyrosine-type recombinase/integrase n=1 Tax=Leucobacter luti TaxID=340320 RepID=UPI001052D641|nr:site-specific integrase [Leucobacter luti]MCW2287059.1 integrase [Leucobacter luti]TCK41283.1 integrase-like protein [Leucobacter luti]